MAPSGATATTLITLVPPVTAMPTLKEPSAAAVVETTVVAEFASVLVAAMVSWLPGAVVPVTVTGEPATELSSAGLVTVSVVAPWVWAT